MINMKKVLILFLLIFVLSSCQKSEKNDEVDIVNTCEHAYSYSLKEDNKTIECECEKCGESSDLSLEFDISYNYGYFDLKRFIGAKNLQKLYITLYAKIIEFINDKKDIEATQKNDKNYYQIASIDYLNMYLDKEQAMAVWHLVILDNPEFYFIEKTVLTSDKEIIILCNEMYAKYEQRLVVDSKINELKNAINKSSDMLTNIDSIYAYIKENMQYAYEDNDTRTPKTDFDSYELSGALLYKEGVCEAYCKLFGYLLKINQIKSIMYVGNGILLSGNYVRHSWTLIEINGLYYGFDITWDDSNSNKENYGLSYENLSKRHVPIEFSSSNLDLGVEYVYSMPKMATENL